MCNELGTQYWGGLGEGETTGVDCSRGTGGRLGDRLQRLLNQRTSNSMRGADAIGGRRDLKTHWPRPARGAVMRVGGGGG